jgi:ubiquinone biosynthesis monooxygenase Coq6
MPNWTFFIWILQVGADGFNSPVRLYAGIPAFGWAYDAKGIVATMFHPPRGAYERPNTTAYQRFIPTGPIAFLPLSPTRSSLVWSTKPDLAAALLACDPAVLASMVNAAFRLPYISIKYLHRRILEGHAAGISITPEEIQHEIHWREQSHGIDQNSAHASALIKSTEQLGIPPIGSESFPPLVTELQTGSVASFPLRYNHAESYIGDSQGARTVLVGDAAHTVHPLAGQGLNLGLADVECLTRCIYASLRSGGDIGELPFVCLSPFLTRAGQKH